MVGKQGFKLQSEEPSFGQQGAMLFYDGEKMGNGVFSWKDDSFAQQGSAFGTTDIPQSGAGSVHFPERRGRRPGGHHPDTAGCDALHRLCAAL